MKITLRILPFLPLSMRNKVKVYHIENAPKWLMVAPIIGVIDPNWSSAKVKKYGLVNKRFIPGASLVFLHPLILLLKQYGLLLNQSGVPTSPIYREIHNFIFQLIKSDSKANSFRQYFLKNVSRNDHSKIETHFEKRINSLAQNFFFQAIKKTQPGNNRWPRSIVQRYYFKKSFPTPMSVLQTLRYPTGYQDRSRAPGRNILTMSGEDRQIGPIISRYYFREWLAVQMNTANTTNTGGMVNQSSGSERFKFQPTLPSKLNKGKSLMQASLHRINLTKKDSPPDWFLFNQYNKAKAYRAFLSSGEYDAAQSKELVKGIGVLQFNDNLPPRLQLQHSKTFADQQNTKDLGFDSYQHRKIDLTHSQPINPPPVEFSNKGFPQFTSNEEDGFKISKIEPQFIQAEIKKTIGNSMVIHRIADQVFSILERNLRIERERMGF